MWKFICLFVPFIARGTSIGTTSSLFMAQAIKIQISTEIAHSVEKIKKNTFISIFPRDRVKPRDATIVLYYGDGSKAYCYVIWVIA